MNSCYLRSDIRIIINISRVNIIVDPETTKQLSDEIMDSFLSSFAVGVHDWNPSAKCVYIKSGILVLWAIRTLTECKWRFFFLLSFQIWLSSTALGQLSFSSLFLYCIFSKDEWSSFKEPYWYTKFGLSPSQKRKTHYPGPRFSVKFPRIRMARECKCPTYAPATPPRFLGFETLIVAYWTLYQ